MTWELFFRGFFAALAIQEVKFIATRDNAHHRRFQAAVLALVALPEKDKDDLPIFIPSPFTGRFREFDAALSLALDWGLLSVSGLFSGGFHIEMTNSCAARILNRYSARHQALFQRLALAFAGSDISS